MGICLSRYFSTQRKSSPVFSYRVSTAPWLCCIHLAAEAEKVYQKSEASETQRATETGISTLSSHISHDVLCFFNLTGYETNH